MTDPRAPLDAARRRTVLALAAGALAATAPGVRAAAPGSRALAAAAQYSAERRGVSMLVMQAGATLFEDYPNEGAPGRAWETASGTKSFSGILAAAAVADGLLRLDARCSDALPEWHDGPRAAITVRELLSLTSGLPGGALGRPPPYAEAVEAQPTAGRGERFQYGPVPFQAFGELVRRTLEAAGRPGDPFDYLRARVLDRIGVPVDRWRRGPDRMPLLPQGAALTARAWARFGQWVLDGGTGVDPAALAACFEGTRANPGYGLSWWLLRPGLVAPSPRSGVNTATGERLGDEDVVMAAGAGHQRLYLMRRRGWVVVRQASGIVQAMTGRGEAWDDAEFLGRLIG